MHRGFEFIARAFLALTAALLVASCGSGAVGSVVVDPTRITIQPGSEVTPPVLYSGLPTTFVITGGTGTYIVSSSNQAIVQVSGPIIGNTLTVVPNPVVADTTLVLSVRDTGTTLPTSVTLIVRPGTVSNTITIAPGSSACSPAVCSGGDAVVTATISQGGIPLPARGVRFDVISGDVRFVTSPAGLPETVGLSVTTVTDETGAARARLRALDAAANQTAIIQITDLGSGAYQRTTIIVARATADQVGFFTVPTSVTFTGPDNQTCASSISSEIFIFGGAPPYTISNSQPSAFLTNTSVVNFSGGSFRVTPSGICGNGTFAITDSAARTTTVTVTNELGSRDPPPAPLSVVPSSLNLNSCAASANAVIVGGQTTNYVAASSSGFVLATVTGSLLKVSRAPTTNVGLPPSGVTVTVSDGRSTFDVFVSLTGTALTGNPPGTGNCP
jgi:hypothetical protein